LLDRNTISRIANIAVKHDFYILSDEPYEDILFSGEHVRIGSIEGVEDRTISVFTFSNSYVLPSINFKEIGDIAKWKSCRF
jgi:aspartate/methionine/tyrosine aminotransferase